MRSGVLERFEFVELGSVLIVLCSSTNVALICL